MNSPLLLLTPLFLLFTACERENYDIVTDMELPRDTVIIEEIPNDYFRQAITNVDTIQGRGSARYDRETRQIIIKDTEPEFITYDCPTTADPSFGWSGSGGGGTLTVFAQFNENGEIISRMYDYNRAINGSPYRLLAACSRHQLELQVDTIADVVTGRIDAEMIDLFYILDHGYPTGEACDTVETVPITVDFSIPLTYCD